MTDLAPFAGASDLENRLQRPVPRDTAVDALRAASGAIRGHCRWSVSEEVVTGYKVTQRRLSGNFWLPTLWLQTVDLIVEDGVTLLTSYYDWDTSGRVVRGSGYWSPYMRSIVVDYTHGYEADDFRLETVRDVCLAAAARLVANPLRHSTESTGNESWGMGVAAAGSTLTDGEKQQLAHLVIEDP